MPQSKANKSNLNSDFNEGLWDEEESMKYLIFLDLNKTIMASRQKRKIHRVFDHMSQFICTRTSLQCRSHHQKAIQKHKQVKEIIQNSKKLLDIYAYRVQLKEARDKAKIKQIQKDNIQNALVNSQNSQKSEKFDANENQNFQHGNLHSTTFYNAVAPNFYPLIQFPANHFGLQYYYFPTFVAPYNTLNL